MAAELADPEEGRRFDARGLFEQNRISVHSHGPLTDGEECTPDLEHTIEVPRLMRLHTEQPDLNHDVLAHYREHGPDVPHPPTMQADHDTPGLAHRPTVASYRGQYWLTDGHHRAVVSRERGEPSFTAWHVDPERDRREYEEWAAGR